MQGRVGLGYLIRCAYSLVRHRRMVGQDRDDACVALGTVAYTIGAAKIV